VLDVAQDYKNLQLPKSQEVIGKLISFSIRATWTERELKELAKNISTCVSKALSTVNV
jgi:8-amino-3,8-dideoxy-alpha-D-manno-octulosonate transaminase